MGKARIERTHRKSESVTYEETFANAEVQRRTERTTSVSVDKKTLYIESDVYVKPPNGSEIVPDAGPMRRARAVQPPQIPRLSGDRVDGGDA